MKSVQSISVMRKSYLLNFNPRKYQKLAANYTIYRSTEDASWKSITAYLQELHRRLAITYCRLHQFTNARRYVKYSPPNTTSATARQQLMDKNSQVSKNETR
jgi:hypothetical protein